MLLGAVKYMTGSEAEDALDAAEEYRDDPARYRGNAVFDATGSAEAAFMADFAPQAIATVLGVKSPKAFQHYSTSKKARLIKEYVDDVAKNEVPPTQRLVAPVEGTKTTTQVLPEQVIAETALTPIQRAEMGQRVVNNAAAKEAVRQGFSEKRV